jgi:hypothetical protein
MADPAGSDPAFQQRPLERPALAGGEQFIEPADMAGPRIDDDGWVPQEEWEVPHKLGPPLQRMLKDAERLVRARDGRIVVEARLMPNFLAASNWPGQLISDLGAIPVGSRLASTEWITRKSITPDVPTKTVLLSVDDDALSRLGEVIGKPTSAQRERGLVMEAARFDDLRLAPPATIFKAGTGEIRTDPEGKALLESVLHPQLSPDGQPDPDGLAGLLDDWANLVSELGGGINYEYATEDQGLQFVPLTLPAHAIDDALRFAQLRVMRPVPGIRPPGSPSGLGSAPEMTPATRVRAERRIAVFDGGVDLSIPGLAGYVSDEDLTGGTPILPEYSAHGTAVCSAALYGHLAEGEHPTVPHAMVDHFRVWPPPADQRHDADLAWVLSCIERVVARGDHRLVVISLAPDLSVEDYEPHAWTVKLDRLSATHDVLFIVAAGNTGDLAPGVDRLLIPADAVNALSVGACTGPSGTVVRADYSSRGPGRPGGRTAPHGVQFGGELPGAPFRALASSGTLAGHEGTSFAAPLVARGLAELEIEIGNRGDANLLRTLAVHHADPPSNNQQQDAGSTTSEVGYGRLRTSYAEHLEHAENAVTIVTQGTIRRREQLTIPFAIPAEVFTDHPTRNFQVRWTLGFLGPVEPANTADYSCGGLRVVFRPHAERYTFSPPDGQPGQPLELDRTVDLSMIENLVDRQGWRMSKRPVSSEKTGYAPEVLKRSRDGKWETIVRMKRGMQGRSLLDPSVDIHMLGREAGNLADIEDLRFAFVLSVEGPAGCDLYQRTLAHAPALVPLTTAVPVTVRANV